MNIEIENVIEISTPTQLTYGNIKYKRFLVAFLIQRNKEGYYSGLSLSYNLILTHLYSIIGSDIRNVR